MTCENDLGHGRSITRSPRSPYSEVDVARVLLMVPVGAPRERQRRYVDSSLIVTSRSWSSPCGNSSRVNRRIFIY
jgi:hypothetical protein